MDDEELTYFIAKACSTLVDAGGLKADAHSLRQSLIRKVTEEPYTLRKFREEFVVEEDSLGPRRNKQKLHAKDPFHVVHEGVHIQDTFGKARGRPEAAEQILELCRLMMDQGATKEKGNLHRNTLHALVQDGHFSNSDTAKLAERKANESKWSTVAGLIIGLVGIPVWATGQLEADILLQSVVWAARLDPRGCRKAAGRRGASL